MSGAQGGGFDQGEYDRPGTGAKVEPVYAVALPDEFPGAWQNLAKVVRRYLTNRLLEKQLELHDGSAGLIESLYRGQTRPGVGLKLDRISYQATARDIWPFVVADVRAWLVAQGVDRATGDDNGGGAGR